MNAASLFRLLALAAIWGASFLFMRIAVPSLGPVWLIMGRVASAALFLVAVAWMLRRALSLRAHWRHYLLLGLLNCALPFVLFAYAALTLSASLLSVLNATAPIWGAVIAAAGARRRPAAATLCGLALGLAGVAVVVGFDAPTLNPGVPSAAAAALAAAFCYGIASVYVKSAAKVDPVANAHGCMWGAVVLVAPALPFNPIGTTPSAVAVAAMLSLGVLCSGVAYLLYFRLIADLGPASALTVTFLIPLFGVLWGHVFLNERVGWHTLIGGAGVLVGTALVTGFSWRTALSADAAHSRQRTK